MSGYTKESREFFKVSDSPEVMTWFLNGKDKHDDNRLYTLKLLREMYGLEVKSYEVRMLPEECRRNKYDCAKLIIVKTVDGKHLAKRYSNNNKFKITL